MAFATPLRYPGGKGSLGPWIAETLQQNGILGGTYAEPYAGGAGAAIFLLTQGYVDQIIINDADPAIYAFWWSILNQHDRFLAKLRRCTVTLEARRRHLNILASPNSYTLLELGFAAFFLNRTNRSGILKGGVIGGKEQVGKYRIDARFNRHELACRIEKIAALRNRIELHGIDALALMTGLKKRLSRRSLVYLDPPYYQKGAQLYRNYYEPGDHKEIAAAVLKMKTPWLVTYDNHKEIRDLYSCAATRKFSLYYSTHLSRARKSEIMFYGNIQVVRPPFLKRASPSNTGQLPNISLQLQR